MAPTDPESLPLGLGSVSTIPVITFPELARGFEVETVRVRRANASERHQLLRCEKNAARCDPNLRTPASLGAQDNSGCRRARERRKPKRRSKEEYSVVVKVIISIIINPVRGEALW